jgi:hypothetical protein
MWPLRNAQNLGFGVLMSGGFRLGLHKPLAETAGARRGLTNTAPGSLGD